MSITDSMKFLITGANGQLAGEFIKLLSQKDITHIALSKERLDISNFNEVRKSVKEYKPNFIINCAAYNLVDKAEEEWEKAFLINGIGVKNLLLSSWEVNSVLIHFSTDYVFDGNKKEPYNIANIPNPINKYGISKLLGEKFILQLGYPRYYLIRVSWVFGDGKSSFIMKLLEWMKNTDELKMVDDEISSPTYTEDLTKAVLDLIKSESYGLYHITNSGYCSRYEWARFVTQRLNWNGRLKPIKSEEFNAPAKRPCFSVLDNFPLKETIGYSLSHWQEATEKFLKCHSERIARSLLRG